VLEALLTRRCALAEWGIWNCPSFLENLLPADTASSSFGGAVKTRGEGGDEDEEDKKPKVRVPRWKHVLPSQSAASANTH